MAARSSSCSFWLSSLALSTPCAFAGATAEPQWRRGERMVHGTTRNSPDPTEPAERVRSRLGQCPYA
jgi:hypothetical protein